jgi:outer membrane receptor protein involved in Fe transport
MRRVLSLFAVSVIAVAVIALPGAAQEPVDTTGRDTTGVTRLPDLKVTVTRTPEPLDRVPFAVSVLDRDDLVRGQPKFFVGSSRDW